MQKPHGLDPVWKALSDPTRRRILDLLKDRPRTTGDLASAFSLSRFAVMKHLDVLEGSELVVVRRRGRERWNYLNAIPLRRLYEHYIDPISDGFASSLLRLADATERGFKRKEQPTMQATTEMPIRTMSVEQEITMAAPVGRVFRAFTEELDRWWSPRLYDDPSKVTLEAKVGGALYEEQDGKTALWAIVRCLEPNAKLVLDGPLGISTPVAGVTTFDFAENAGKTTVKLSHRAIGEITEEQIAGYGRGWTQLIQKDLPNWVERNQPHSGYEMRRN